MAQACLQGKGLKRQQADQGANFQKLEKLYENKMIMSSEVLELQCISLYTLHDFEF